MAASRFPNMQVKFKDTRGSGGITVRGITLTTDELGFVEGPPSLEPELEPHGFILEEKWFSALPTEERVKVARQIPGLAGALSHAEQKALRAPQAAKAA